MQYTDKDGKMTNASYLYNDELWRDLNSLNTVFNQITVTVIDNNTQNITLNGLVPPSFTTPEITAFGSNNTIPNGTIFYDKTVKKLKFKSDNNVIETITSAP
jgi:hypothetical protein